MAGMIAEFMDWFQKYTLICAESGAAAVGHGRFPGDFAKHRLKMVQGGKVRQSGDIPQSLVGEAEQAFGLRVFLK